MELSILTEKLLSFVRVDFKSKERTSILSLFNLRQLEESQDLISSKQSLREGW